LIELSIAVERFERVQWTGTIGTFETIGTPGTAFVIKVKPLLTITYHDHASVVVLI